MSAIELLGQAKTVAFAPPDECIEASSGADIARQRCGEVMTALEQAASESGFQVVSWQAFRGNEPALSYARHNNVDVLFEINRLGPDNSSSGYTQTGFLDFYIIHSDNNRIPLSVSSAVQTRCRENLLRNLPAATDTSSIVLDVNMVSVRTGLVLWNYRRLVRSSVESSDKKGTSYFEGIGSPSSVLCTDSARDTSDTQPTDTESNRWTFTHTVAGKESPNEILHRASQLAAGEFIELLVYMQALSPNEKRIPLHAPAQPKATHGQPSLGCATVTDWIQRGSYKPAPNSDYSKNCSRAADQPPPATK